ncbi:MAG: hypothetical protein E6X43_12785 [Peptostreptococcaceae bacterium]|nr:hypothetical protein [Peptostreptococcaceae bacterium]
MRKREKKKWIIDFIYIVYMASIIWFLKERKLFEFGIVVFCIVSTLILGIVNKKVNKLLDNSIYINLVIFIMVSSLLGSCFKFYSINHYDDFLHLYSGILSCNVAYLIIRYFNNEENIKMVNKVFVMIFLFMFTMGVASLWEIMEFSLDNILGTHTQIGGLEDTMIDMVDALIGAIISIPYFIRKMSDKHSKE